MISIKKINEYTAGDTVLNDYAVEEKVGTNENTMIVRGGIVTGVELMV